MPNNRLVTLARLNRTTAFLGALVVGLLGMFLPGALGAVILYGVVGALAALLRLTWGVTPPALRAARVVILATLTVIATLKLAGLP